MKLSSSLLVVLIAAIAMIAGGCSSNDSSSPSAPVTLSAGNGQLEGQLVADAGTQFSKVFLAAQAAPASSVYPLSGVTVELLQNGQVVATTVTDEYGRFQFVALAAGDYDVRAVAPDGAVVHDHVTVTPNQTVAVFGRVMSGDCLWSEELGPRWDDMPRGDHWGQGFQGAAPGTGYWHDGQTWCDPQGSGPHGPRW
ncbi:hypothetical protein U14_03794 [Candidatus Moduliflexus flocculans]|uniref:Carboxypeptidase regulatory-like domain-containing protein n=1 Tax=Candidatus Moduliflexus flocculans TaxID=1499966 RepID=A0A081BQ77_9BACT|nr:hypothetical protein U14_03794 [Candidatus Moduliflexus flocculans]